MVRSFQSVNIRVLPWSPRGKPPDSVGYARIYSPGEPSIYHAVVQGTITAILLKVMGDFAALRSGHKTGTGSQGKAKQTNHCLSMEAIKLLTNPLGAIAP
jgi:hypothetical protein